MVATTTFNFVMKYLPLFVWNGSHLAATRVRDELSQDASEEAVRGNPLASYVNHMLTCFGGGAVANLLLGVSPLEPFFMSTNFLIGSLAWLLVFYCPGDWFYRIAKFSCYNMYLQVLDEIWRGIKVYNGVIQAMVIMSYVFTPVPATTCIFFGALIGTVQGCGGDILKSVRQYLLGRDQTATPMAATTVVNSCFVSAVLFTLCSVLAPSFMHLLFSVVISALIATKLAVLVMGEEKYSAVTQKAAFVALLLATLATTYLVANQYLGRAELAPTL